MSGTLLSRVRPTSKRCLTRGRRKRLDSRNFSTSNTNAPHVYRNDLEMMKKMKEDEKKRELEIKIAERKELIYLD